VFARSLFLPIEDEWQSCSGLSDEAKAQAKAHPTVDDSPTPGGHGTCVADIAVGLENGVAKAATLVPVKMIQEGCTFTSNGMMKIFDIVLKDMEQNNVDGTNAIITISQGGSIFQYAICFLDHL
jgi:hypothetical protein